VDGGQYTVSVAPPATRPELDGSTAPALTADFGSPMARDVMLPDADPGDPPDETPPTIVVSAPRDGGRYTVGDVVTATYSCSDAGSTAALEECAGYSSTSPDVVASGAALATSSTGTFTFTVHARDAAGNESSAAVTYTVTDPSLMGRVTDELGAPVAGMNLVLMNYPMGPTASTLTGADGTYRFPSGAVNASISVLLAYAPASRPDLRLQSGAQVLHTSPPVVVNLVVPFKDIDGIADNIENAGPNGGDGNADGTADSAQAHVVSLPNVVDGRYVTLQSPVGARFQATQSVAPSPPSGDDTPIGAIAYELLVRSPGAAVIVEVTLPPDLDVTEYRAVDGTGTWTDIPGATIDGRVVTLTLTDGGATDADATANGVIVHRGGPVAPGGADADADDDGIDDALEPDPASSSSVFSDSSLTPPTTGAVIDAAGNTVAVTDADDPADGVRVTVSGGGGGDRSVVEVCGLEVGLTVGSDATFTCGSLLVALTAGEVEIERDGGSTRVTLDAGDQARLAAPPAPFSVENVGTSPVAVIVNGAAYDVAGGRTFPGPLHHLVLSPPTAVVPTRVAQPFSVRGADEYGFDLGEVTATLSIVPNGTCSGSSCSATVVGVHSVIARVGNVTGTATLDVRSAQTITFGALATKTMVQGPLTVAATASSSLPVSFSTTTPTVCTAGGSNGTTITFVAAGTCTVRADQPGNATFAAAAPVLRTFAVNKTTQTISFPTLSARSITESSVAIAATASSGLPVSFSSTTPTVCATSGTNGATVELISSGTCTVRADQPGNASHAAAAPVTRSFTVSKVSQSITFPALAAKNLSQTPVVVAATASSGLAVTLTTTTPGVCTASGPDGSTITLVAAGTCTVQATQPGDATYKAAPTVNRSFTVSKVAQAITFPALSARSISDPPVAVAAAASSGLAVAFTTTTPTVCTAGGPGGSLITLVAAGTCTVQATQPGDATYKPAPTVNRSFTVSKLTQTITFPAISVTTRTQSPIVVIATASSGLAVTFTTTTPTVCTAGGPDGSAITLVAAGTCTVRASQLGDATYKAASAVNRSFRVS
ncbi:MAG: carboxypeptidase-like regulatory domain-containing protein, partial [Ilumatobacteraceae bacterium]